MNIITLLTMLGCFGLFVLFCLIMFWVYGLSIILHWIIKSNGEQARAIVLEVRKAGWGWYSGGNYSQTLLFQPVSVKLEVHPNNAAPYITTDKFNANRETFYEKLKPGAEMQVSISSFSPQWVASIPETIVEAQAHRVKGNSANMPGGVDEEDPKVRLRKLKELLDSGLITRQEFAEKRKEILDDM